MFATLFSAGLWPKKQSQNSHVHNKKRTQSFETLEGGDSFKAVQKCSDSSYSSEELFLSAPSLKGRESGQIYVPNVSKQKGVSVVYCSTPSLVPEEGTVTSSPPSSAQEAENFSGVKVSCGVMVSKSPSVKATKDPFSFVSIEDLPRLKEIESQSQDKKEILFISALLKEKLEKCLNWIENNPRRAAAVILGLGLSLGGVVALVLSSGFFFPLILVGAGICLWAMMPIISYLKKAISAHEGSFFWRKNSFGFEEL